MDTTPKNQITVAWVKNTGNGSYFDLLRLDLKAPYFAKPITGVYVLWYVAPGTARAIRVGSGNISEKVVMLRSDPQVLDYGKNGQLKVTWATAPNEPNVYQGMEAYLYDTYKPLTGERATASPIRVSPLI